MIRLATVADARFRQRAANLERSLRNSPNDYRLTIYCDDAEGFGSLGGPRCDVVQLAEVKLLGAKRAKLTAFAMALQGGSVIYLDADAIVLEDLNEMWGGDEIKGVFVDLSRRPFISDHNHPWPQDPNLVNRHYLMSGGFYAPACLYPLFERIRLDSLDDTTWRRYIAEGFLYDQHFLNACLNIYDAPVQPLDATVYGWQGLLKEGVPQVHRSGSHLINRDTRQLLRLILFGGVEQTPEVLRSLPIEIAALIFERIAPSRPHLDHALAQLYASLSEPLATPLPDPFVKDVLALLLAEIPQLAKACQDDAPRTSRPAYFNNPDRVKSAAFANPLPHCTWNGLQCGGAYLDGDEYRQIRAMVRGLNIRTVLETGAGETSILFRKLGAETCSLEYQKGPWVDRAASHGCTCLFVPFDHRNQLYSETELSDRLAAQKIAAVDLLFIDSPIGTQNRQNVLAQLLGCVKARFVLYHDALRDSRNLFADQTRHGLRLISFFDSPRGLVLFALPPYQASGPLPDEFDAATVIPERRAAVAVVDQSATAVAAGSRFWIRIALTNTATVTLSSKYTRPVHVAYHWLTSDGKMVVYDGIRTKLPFDMEPDDTAEMMLEVVAPKQDGQYLLQVRVLQEKVAWFQPADSSAAEVRVHINALSKSAAG